MTPSLISQVRGLVGTAAELYRSTPAEALAAQLVARLDEPLRVAIAGKVKAGKSTLLNALVGESLAPTDAGECTRIVTWYRNGITYRAMIDRRDGSSVPARFSRDSGALEVHLDGHHVDDVERLVIDWPSSTLGTMTLIDTPGIGSLSADAQERTRSFLSADNDLHGPADAVIYLMRHLHSTDARFLEAFHDDRAARATPVNAIGVLSRADEIGGGQAASLKAAARIASRYRADDNVRRLCQTVVPVAGLLAQLGGMMTEREFRAVARLAQLPEDDSASLLTSADRFLSAPSAIGLAPEERSYLIERFGIFGLRLSLALMAMGKATSSRSLADELRRRSGLDELRKELTTHFSMRRDVLKSRSTLLGLEELLRRFPLASAEQLARDIERVHAGAHELAELRVLTAMRAGALRLDEDEVAEIERLLGAAAGMASGPRLGLAVDAGTRQLRTAALAAHGRWAVRAEHPMTPAPVSEAARVIQRSYEAMIAQLMELERVAG